MSQTYDIFIYRLFLFSFEQRNQKDCRPIVFLQSKNCLPFSLKPFLHLNSTDPFLPQKNLSHIKILFTIRTLYHSKASQKGCDNFILNTLPQSCKALIKFFIWNCHKSLPELSHKRFHHRLFSHRTASLSSLLHFPSNNYNVLKPYSTLIASTSAASIPCFLLGSKKPPGDIVWNQTDRFSTLLVQKLFAVLIQNIPVAVWKHFATHCRASQ